MAHTLSFIMNIDFTKYRFAADGRLVSKDDPDAITDITKLDADFNKKACDFLEIEPRTYVPPTVLEKSQRTLERIERNRLSQKSDSDADRMIRYLSRIPFDEMRRIVVMNNSRKGGIPKSEMREIFIQNGWSYNEYKEYQTKIKTTNRQQRIARNEHE